MADLYKTTLVIWSESDPQKTEINDLAYDAVYGDSYCSKRTSQVIEDPRSDPDWDGTEFFDLSL